MLINLCPIPCIREHINTLFTTSELLNFLHTECHCLSDEFIGHFFCEKENLLSRSLSKKSYRKEVSGSVHCLYLNLYPKPSDIFINTLPVLCGLINKLYFYHAVALHRCKKRDLVFIRRGKVLPHLAPCPASFGNKLFDRRLAFGALNL